jgi:hypothetical protein
MADLAFEAAAAHFERALGSLELVDDPPLDVRCDPLLERADAFQLGGDERRYPAVYEAAAAARAVGDPDRLARAALILVRTSTGSTRAGTVDAELVALLEEALAGIPTEASPLRAILLSSLATEIQWGGDHDRRMALAREALEMARSTRDSDALGHVLGRSWAMIDATQPWHVDFKDLLDEAEAVVSETDDAFVVREVHRYNIWLAAMRGDHDEMESRFDLYCRVVDQMRRPAATALRRFDEAAVAEFAGRLADAERITLEAAELAGRADMPEGVIGAFLGGLLYYIRLNQGRSDELVGTLEDLVESQPGAPVWHVALAGALVECDRVDDARAHFMWLADDDCANVPPDVEYPVTIDGLARMAYRVQPPEAVMRSIHGRLLPFAGFMNWSGVGISGPNDLGLAMISAALGYCDDSDRYFASTLELVERAGARCWIARTHFDWSRTLADRGDTAGVREHAEIAVALGEELSMDGPFGVVPRGRALLESLSRPPT